MNSPISKVLQKLEDLKKQSLNALRVGYTEPATYLAQLVAEKGEPDFPVVLEAAGRLAGGSGNGKKTG